MTKAYERISKSQYYLNVAIEVSKRSTCLVRHYGVVLVNNDVIVSTGYNGSARGETNCSDTGICVRGKAERYSGYDDCVAVHAEVNAIIASSHDEMRGSTLYIVCEDWDGLRSWQESYNPLPCVHCRRIVKNSGIKYLVHRTGKDTPKKYEVSEL